jgi:ubiquinone biosynthesis O-methyltransferase
VSLPHLPQPGGHIVLTTINRTLQSFLTVIAGAEYVLRLLPRGTHDWTGFRTPEELAAGLEQSQGVGVDWVRGMCFNPLTSQWAWSNSTAVNYALRAVRTKQSP